MSNITPEIRNPPSNAYTKETERLHLADDNIISDVRRDSRIGVPIQISECLVGVKNSNDSIACLHNAGGALDELGELGTGGNDASAVVNGGAGEESGDGIGITVGDN